VRRGEQITREIKIRARARARARVRVKVTESWVRA